MSASTDAAQPAPTKPLPPGMVLGPDGKPCKICTAFRSRVKIPKVTSASKTGGSTAQSSKATATGATTAAVAGVASGTLLGDDGRPANCPPDVEQLGRATWTFLHTTAAYYPPSPSLSQKTQMIGLLNALPSLYPCGHCASHLGKEMAARPPDVTSRERLGRWLCNVHNEVNERLGKDKFDCAKVDERWKDGPADGSCD